MVVYSNKGMVLSKLVRNKSLFVAGTHLYCSSRSIIMLVHKFQQSEFSQSSPSVFHQASQVFQGRLGVNETPRK